MKNTILVLSLFTIQTVFAKDIKTTEKNCAQARFYENLALRELKYSSNSNLAILYYKLAISICPSFDPDIWLTFANVSFENGDTIKALDYVYHSARLGNKIWDNSSEFLIYINKNKKLSNLLKQRSDSALKYYDQNFTFYDSIIKLDQQVRSTTIESKNIEKIYEIDKTINKVLIEKIKDKGIPKSSTISYDNLHHFFIIVMRHQLSGGRITTSDEDFDLINMAMLNAIYEGELDPYIYALILDERSYSIESTTYYGVLKESRPEVKVNTEGIDEKLQKIGLLPIYLDAQYWEKHKAGLNWYINY